MEFRELSVPDAFEFTPATFPDARGVFTAPFQLEPFTEAVGHGLTVKQTNVSMSRKGAFRGIHYADVPPSQAKYVTAVSGSLLDFVVDLREGSPTFGKWDCVLLDTVDRRAVYLPEGLGHALFALEDDSTALYLCSEAFAPRREHGISPQDPDINLQLPPGIEPVVSEKDAAAPLLSELAGTGTLPTYAACREFYSTLT
ncbi:dTDP-4-dehydrorhamnose 3,5-epimerase family protein [Pedococcus sp. 5OH_020]|uniref:dTDP-4-dehydrorhamnose 3,5-epimerase family protein n=1 Tax=Pedococcus sp. 5OH_020 TaxID=2989814 RepID=UPI0022E9A1C3|nr:dTDP-4-dehydrorhamnose 3,5-epimerase family protein [Pedococcus sp. 5OH_020]